MKLPRVKITAVLERLTVTQVLKSSRNNMASFWGAEKARAERRSISYNLMKYKSKLKNFREEKGKGSSSRNEG